MTTWEETWKNIGTDIPSLLPLSAVPQEPDPGKMLNYLTGLHNYLADDRLKIVRAINVLARFRSIQTDDNTDSEIPATGSGALKIQADTAELSFDAISQEAVSAAVWSPLAMDADNIFGDFDHIDFELSPAGAAQTGRMQWNPVDGVMEVGLIGNEVVHQMGPESPLLCENQSGGDIDNGQVVYISGGSGSKPRIDLSKADAKSTTFVLGVATEDIGDGNSGYVTTRGRVRDIDTQLFSPGDTIFLSATVAGGLETFPAPAPNYKARVGYCIVSDAVNGVLLVDPSVVSSLRNLTDVETQAPAANDCPVWSVDNQWFDMTNIGGFFNGTFIETFSAVVTEAGGVVTMSLEQEGGGDLTMKFSGGEHDLDCTSPLQTIVLTAGTDPAPQANYIYILESDKILTKSTSQWPSAEHIKVGYFLVPSATLVGTDGCYINQNWNDHREGTDGQGHLAHICESIRLTMRGAAWNSGVAGAASGAEYLELAASNIDWKSTAGVAYQMHKHIIPAIDMSTGDDCHVVNWSGDAYHQIGDLFEIVADSTGASVNNKYFNLVFWGVANKTGEYTPLMCNLPNGFYTTEVNAIADVSSYDVTNIPHEFTSDSCTGFLICRITVKKAGTAWTISNTVDLRGNIPSVAAGGAGSASAITDFSDNLFTIFNLSDVTKILDFDLSGIATGNTRTLTAPDASGILALTSDLSAYLPLAGGTMSGSILLGSGLAIDTSAAHDLLLKRNGTTVFSHDGNVGELLGPLRANGGFGADFQVWDGTGWVSAVYMNGATNLELGDSAKNLILTATGVEIPTGDVTIEEGNLYLDKTSNPSIFLRQGGSATDSSVIYDSGTRLRIDRDDPNGHCYIDINPESGHASGGGFLQFGRYANNAIGMLFRIFEGDGTTTYNHTLRSSGYDSQICSTGGSLVIGGTAAAGALLDVRGDALFSSEITVGYLAGIPASPANGMMWMESDGLHIYYAGAEKVVAGV